MLTTAQTARVAAARQEAKAGGTRITTRQLPGGLVVVTDHDPHDGQTVTATMGKDGNYLR